MPRTNQGKASRGSQKWLQILVNEKTEVVNTQIKQALELSKSDTVIWKSPLAEDDYSEYSDDRFLSELNINLTRVRLEKFWPKRGPVWDGLAIAGELKILVEAKAHIGETVSGPSKARSKKSIGKITESLNEIKKYLNSKSDWSGTFYQYINRLAHLYFLRKLNGINAHLVFIYFFNDIDMKGPKSQSEWEGAINLLHAYLGIGRHKLTRYVHDVFIDVNKLK